MCAEILKAIAEALGVKQLSNRVEVELANSLVTSPWRGIPEGRRGSSRW